jgi:small subunit ribosomal protein S9
MKKATTKTIVNDAPFKVHGVGRRKSSVARVWLKNGSGNIEINGSNYAEYLDTDVNRSLVELPLKVTGSDKKFDIMVNVHGGGMAGQTDAIKLGIARALLETNEALKTVLRQNGLLTVDSRVKERKKYGQKAARRKFQFVKR